MGRALVCCDRQRGNYLCKVGAPGARTKGQVIPVAPTIGTTFMRRQRCRGGAKVSYGIAVSNCASFVFMGHFKRYRRRDAVGGNVSHVVHSYGRRRLTGYRDNAVGPGGLILLPGFDYRSLQRAYTAQLYRTKVGVGIVRSMLNRTSVAAAVGVCARTAGGLGGGRVSGFTRFLSTAAAFSKGRRGS